MTSAYSYPALFQPVVPMYRPAVTDYHTEPNSHFSRRDHIGNTRSVQDQPPGVAGSRGRSIRRDFVFGTPPDYVPTSPPEEFMRRGRDRARTSTSMESVRGSSLSQGRDSGLSPRSNHAVPMSPDHYSRSRTLSQPHSGHRHHRHQYRDPTPARAVSPTRPSHSRRRSRSLPPSHHAYYQGHYYPSTANSRAPFQLATSAAPAVDSRNRTGFFSWLFGPKVRNTHRHTRASQSVSTRYMQPYVGYSNPTFALGAPGLQGTTRYQVPQASFHNAHQGHAVAQMYTHHPNHHR